MTKLFDDVENYLVAAADGSMSRNNSEALAAELLEQVRAERKDVQNAILLEREACAQVCDALVYVESKDFDTGETWISEPDPGALACAAAIRAMK